jgi:hypothetical protein
MRRPLLLALAALTLAVPAQTEAASRVFPVAEGNAAPAPAILSVTQGRLFGPFLAGEEVVFLERRYGSIGLIADGPAGRRTLETIPDTLNEDAHYASLDVAEGRVALTTYRVSCNGDLACSRYAGQYPQDFRLRSGPVSGPLQTLAGCDAYAVAVAASVVAAQCSSGFDLIADGKPVEHVADLMAPHLAGDYVAAAVTTPSATPQWTGLRVLKRDPREEALRVETPVQAFDVTPDGSVAYVLDDDTHRTIGWSSPADPAVHRLTVPDEPVSVVASGDLIAARLGALRTGRIVVLGRDGQTRFDVTDPAMIGTADFDGARLAWAREPCSRPSIVVWDLSGPRPDLPGDDCTMPRTPAAPLRLGRDRRVSVTLTCPATAPAGCAGVASLAVYLRRRPRGHRRLWGSRAATFDLLAGEAKTVRARVSKKGLRRSRSGEVLVHTQLLRGQEEEIRRVLRLRR